MSDLPQTSVPTPSTSGALVAIAWLAVLIPLGYGFFETLLKAINLFSG